jgi:hypothetical protein
MGFTGNERWVPHSSPVFGLEWDTTALDPLLFVIMKTWGTASAVPHSLKNHLARKLKNASSAERAWHLLDPRDGTETIGIDEA